MKRTATIVISILLLTGCSSTVGGSKVDPLPSESSSTIDKGSNDDTVPSEPNSAENLPGEWSSTQVKIFNLFSAIYPVAGFMDLRGKRALMENSDLICQAFDEGYSRSEILDATSGAEFTSKMSDDWMTLSVTYLCPRHLDLQIGN